MTRLQRAIIALEQATAARDDHRAREQAKVDREWAALMLRLETELGAACADEWAVANIAARRGEKCTS